MREIQFVFPLPDNDELSVQLRKLTKALHERGLADGEQGGIFGGAWGYGADFENDTFMLHRYCWCESEDCPWCAGCSCEEPARYEIAGREVEKSEYEAYWAAYSAMKDRFDAGAAPPAPWNVWPRDVKWLPLHPCRYCRGEFGNAPNFHHKPSGLKVRWYKYIGRGMEVTAPQRVNLDALFAECHASIGAVGGHA
jgi:hypothetical protein